MLRSPPAKRRVLVLMLIMFFVVVLVLASNLAKTSSSSRAAPAVAAVAMVVLLGVALVANESLGRTRPYGLRRSRAGQAAAVAAWLGVIVRATHYWWRSSKPNDPDGTDDGKIRYVPLRT